LTFGAGPLESDIDWELECRWLILLVVRLVQEKGTDISDEGDKGSESRFFSGEEEVEEAVRGGVGGAMPRSSRGGLNIG
jgi:hypothetical protein